MQEDANLNGIGDACEGVDQGVGLQSVVVAPQTFNRFVGDKRYELSNHLGNVLSVVSDRKLFQNTLSFTTFAPDVLSYSDYYPFVMLVPNRHKTGDDYRYGFQGQEKDDELKGEGNSINYTFRMHDPRVGRFFAPDPLFKEYPHYTPYSFSGNKVIASVELEGLEDVWVADGSNIVKKVGPYVGAYTSEQAANNRFLEATARKPKVARLQAEIRSDNLEDQVNKFRGVNPGLAISRGVIDGFQEAPEVILPEIAFAKVAKVYTAFKQAKIALKAAESGDEVAKGVDIVLKYKAGWSAEQKAAAAAKAKALTEAETVVVKNPQRASNLRNRYQKAGNIIKPTEDVDHVVDLQLGGADDILTNTQPLDRSVNRSLGKQINNKIKGLPEGTKINKVEFKD